MFSIRRLINKVTSIRYRGLNLKLAVLVLVSISGTTYYYTNPTYGLLSEPNDDGILAVHKLPAERKDVICAVMTVVVRNDQLEPMVETMTNFQGALRNQSSPYGWAFFSEEDLTDEFKSTISKFSGGSKVSYGRIPEGMKAHPGFAAPTSDDLKIRLELLNNDVNSTQFVNTQTIANHEILKEYNWHMMVYPGSKFSTVFDYDIFREMDYRGIVYGYGMPDYVDDGKNDSTSLIQQQQQRCQSVEYPQNVASIPWMSEFAEADNSDDGHVLGGKPTKVIFNGKMRMGDHELSLDEAGTNAESPLPTALIHSLGMPGASFEIGSLDIFRDPSYSEISKVVGHITTDHVFSSPALNTDSGCRGHPFQHQKTGDEASTGATATHGASAGAHGMAARRQRTSGVFIVLDDSSKSLSALHAH